MRRIALASGFILLGAPGVAVGFHHNWWAVFAVVPLAWGLVWLIIPPKARP